MRIKSSLQKKKKSERTNLNAWGFQETPVFMLSVAAS
jgi:hypothetical protein